MSITTPPVGILCGEMSTALDHCQVCDSPMNKNYIVHGTTSPLDFSEVYICPVQPHPAFYFVR